jgi:hypothetical protein
MGDITQIKMSIMERIVRIGIGYGLIVTTMTASAPGEFLLLLPLLAIYPVLTGMFGWDPVFELLGKKIRTLIRFLDKKAAQFIESSFIKTNQR